MHRIKTRIFCEVYHKITRGTLAWHFNSSYADHHLWMQVLTGSGGYNATWSNIGISLLKRESHSHQWWTLNRNARKFTNITCEMKSMHVYSAFATCTPLRIQSFVLRSRQQREMPCTQWNWYSGQLFVLLSRIVTNAANGEYDHARDTYKMMIKCQFLNQMQSLDDLYHSKCFQAWNLFKDSKERS